jgi:hypothetical protein
VAYLAARHGAPRVHLLTLDHGHGYLFKSWASRTARSLARSLGAERVVHRFVDTRALHRELALGSLLEDRRRYGGWFGCCPHAVTAQFADKGLGDTVDERICLDIGDHPFAGHRVLLTGIGRHHCRVKGQKKRNNRSGAGQEILGQYVGRVDESAQVNKLGVAGRNKGDQRGAEGEFHISLGCHAVYGRFYKVGDFLRGWIDIFHSQRPPIYSDTRGSDLGASLYSTANYKTTARQNEDPEIGFLVFRDTAFALRGRMKKVPSFGQVVRNPTPNFPARIQAQRVQNRYA